MTAVLRRDRRPAREVGRSGQGMRAVEARLKRSRRRADRLRQGEDRLDEGVEVGGFHCQSAAQPGREGPQAQTSRTLCRVGYGP